MKKLLIAVLTLSCVLCFAGCKNPFARDNIHGRTDYVQNDDNDDDNDSGQIGFKDPRKDRSKPIPRPRPIPEPSPVIPR